MTAKKYFPLILSTPLHPPQSFWPEMEPLEDVGWNRIATNLPGKHVYITSCFVFYCPTLSLLLTHFSLSLSLSLTLTLSHLSHSGSFSHFSF